MNVRDGIRMFAVTCAAAVALAGRAETACVRIGYPEGAKGVRYETRTVELEKSGDPRWMEGDGVEDPYVALKIVEFGGRPIFYTYKFADVPRIKKARDEFVPVRHLQRELMTEHRTLAPGVFLTAYGDGSKTVCNYTDKTYVHAGTPVRPMSYILLHPNGSVSQPHCSELTSPDGRNKWGVWKLDDCTREERTVTTSNRRDILPKLLIEETEQPKRNLVVDS